MYTHTQEYYSAKRKKEVLPFATMWMDFESIMLSEISLAEKDKHCVISPVCGISKTNQNKTKPQKNSGHKVG